MFRLFKVLQQLLDLEFFYETSIATDIKFDLFDNDVFPLDQTKSHKDLTLRWADFSLLFVYTYLLPK